MYNSVQKLIRDEVPGDMPLRSSIKPGVLQHSCTSSLGLCIVRSYTPCLHAAGLRVILKCWKNVCSDL